MNATDNSAKNSISSLRKSNTLTSYAFGNTLSKGTHKHTLPPNTAHNYWLEITKTSENDD